MNYKQKILLAFALIALITAWLVKSERDSILLKIIPILGVALVLLDGFGVAIPWLTDSKSDLPRYEDDSEPSLSFTGLQRSYGFSN